MFEKLFGRKDLFVPRMPEVEASISIDDIFQQARSAAAASERRVVIVTPGRMLMFQPCQAPGTMDKEAAGIEQIIPSKVKRNIAVIAYTELDAVRKNPAKAIPFIGILLGFAYIGHSVWAFEGHASALEAGGQDADVLFVDSGMIPHLSDNFQSAVTKRMRHPEIYIHDRATFSLRRMQHTG